MSSILSVSDFLGYAAAGLVLATFSLRSMAGLRSAAIASNVMFIAYAISADLIPILILHVLLLPLNTWRLHEDIAKHAGVSLCAECSRARPDHFAKCRAPALEPSPDEAHASAPINVSSRLRQCA